MSNTRDACAEIRWVRRCLRSSLSHQTPVAVTSSGHAGRSEDKGLPASRHATSAFASHRLHSCDPKIHLLHLSSSFRMVVRTSSVIGLYHGDMKKKTRRLRDVELKLSVTQAPTPNSLGFTWTPDTPLRHNGTGQRSESATKTVNAMS